MPMRPIHLARRRARFSIAKHSSRDRSISHGPPRWGLSERRRGPRTCAQSVLKFRHLSLPNTSSSYTSLVAFHPNRNFSNTSRTEGIWDEEDEVPEPKPVQRTPGRARFVRPTHHRDLTSLIRSRADGKLRVSERQRIEKEFHSLPSYRTLVDTFIQLKYKHITDLVVKSAKSTESCVTEWETRSTPIRAKIAAMLSDLTDAVLEAEKITQEYIAETKQLSSSILHRIQVAIMNSRNTGRMIEHDFCRIVFARTPELERELQISAQNIRGWRESFRMTLRAILERGVNISERSTRQLRDTLSNDYLRPWDTARSRIDHVLHQSDLFEKDYTELQLKASHTKVHTIKNLCVGFQNNTYISPADRWVFRQYKNLIEHSHREISQAAHRHRAFWRRRQMASHPLRQSELWNLSDFMAAAAAARSPRANDVSLILALALGAPKTSPASQFLRNSPLLISNKIHLMYKRLWMPKPARSPELHIYWRQLDVVAPLQTTSVLTWRLQIEGWYLHHSLRGDYGSLWARVPPQTLRRTITNLADWCLKFQQHRSALLKMTNDYVHLNWLRLQSETLLHSMGEPVYLAGKFEVLDPMSQDVRRLRQWTDCIGQLVSKAHVTLIATMRTQEEWDFIHSKIENSLRQDARVDRHYLELGSSVYKPRRKKGREESRSLRINAALLKSSRSYLMRYTKGKVSSHLESPLASQDNQGPSQVVSPPRAASRKRVRRPRRGKRQHTADSATNQGSQVDHKGTPSTINPERHKTQGNILSRPLPMDVPVVQHNQENIQVIWRPLSTLWKREVKSQDAPASQTNQEGNQALPKPPPMLSKSKSVSLSTEPHTGELHSPIPREIRNSCPATRTPNGPQPALTLLRKPFATPKRNNGRKYSTDAIFHQMKFRQSGVSNDSLSERSFENTTSSVSDTMIRDSPGSIEEDDSAVESMPSSNTDPSANNLTTSKFWSHSSQQSPDGRKLIVHYCRTLQHTEEAVQLFLGSNVIGFDMEWKAQASGWDSIQSNVSVIQIANEERIAIFQVALFKPARSLEDLVSPSLKRLIESPDVIKVGVSIKADCTRLRKYLGVHARATFELSHLYKLIKYGKDNPKLVNKRGVNLSEQVNEHFGLPLEKSDDVRCSDWTRPLSYRQVQYAATDPYACVRLFHTMEAKRQAMNPMPPRPAFAELNQPIILSFGQAVNTEEDPLI